MKTRNWLVPTLLLLLGALNVISGAFQLDSIQQGPPAVPDEFTTMEYFTSPIPIVGHIIFGIFLNILGPLQFAPVTWRRWPMWHRWSGRLLIVSGFVVAASGLWMNHFYPQYGGLLKYPGIVVNSIGIAASMALALWYIRSRDIPSHRKWMMRAIAFGLGPATQRLFLLPVFLIYGMVSDMTIGIVIWLGFLLNLAVVEWVLARERRNPADNKNTALEGASL